MNFAEFLTEVVVQRNKLVKRLADLDETILKTLGEFQVEMVPLAYSIGRIHISGDKIVGIIDDGAPRFRVDGAEKWVLADDPEEPYVPVRPIEPEPSCQTMPGPSYKGRGAWADA